MSTAVALQPSELPIAVASVDVPRLLEAFLSGRSPRTIEAYRADLEGFRRWLGALSVDGAARLLLARSHGEANSIGLAYRAHLLDAGLAPATVNRRLAALRSLVKLARVLGLVAWTLEVSSVKSEPYRDTKGPGRAGFVALLAALAPRRDAKGARDRAILHLLFDLALRRAEVCSLDLAHLDLEAGTLSVLGKGRTERVRLTLPAPTMEALKAWIEHRGAESGPLFRNFDPARKGDGRLVGRSLARMVGELGDRAGIRARPHGLRHAAITEALDLTGGDVRAVQRFSRHRDLRVLLRYDDSRADLGGKVAALVAGAASLSETKAAI